ncbi:MAG: hypothetical protein KatS3mg097_160 [Candidatus Parcubacteria bacterium]|nr:MAG: hypothetical protein KatS3mg097_160 [Candidatus Parcubacteria bacterium]
MIFWVDNNKNFFFKITPLQEIKNPINPFK